jgi:hypothetical protein
VRPGKREIERGRERDRARERARETVSFVSENVRFRLGLVNPGKLKLVRPIGCNAFAFFFVFETVTSGDKEYVRRRKKSKGQSNMPNACRVSYWFMATG